MAGAHRAFRVDSGRPRHHHRGSESARVSGRRSLPAMMQEPVKRPCPMPIRSSPRPFGIFAAEGLDQDRQARRTGEGRPPAGLGADRHRQHVRGAGILRQDGGLWHPADRRLRTRRRFRRPGPERAQCAGLGAVANRIAGGAGARLPQPDAAEFAGVSGNADPSIAAYQARMAGRRCRGFDRADRRPRRARSRWRCMPITPPSRAPVATGWRICSAIASMSNCSATASTRSAAPNPA